MPGSFLIKESVLGGRGITTSSIFHAYNCKIIPKKISIKPAKDKTILKIDTIKTFVPLVEIYPIRDQVVIKKPMIINNRGQFILSTPLIDGKCVAKSLNCFEAYFLLNMKIMLCHIHFGVSAYTLNCRNVHSQRLHHRNISMTARVRG